MDEQATFYLLHVDDDPDLAEVTAEYLQRYDDRFEIDIATNATDGLDHLAQTEYDCVVSDYDMPRQNGIEFLQAVREEYPDLPFILYTGKGSEEVASEAISAGVSDYLQKESGTEQYAVLANRITNLVSRYRAETRVERYAEAEAESEHYRQQLLELMSDPNRSDDEKIDRLLALGCERLGVENGHLVMIDKVAGKHDVISVHGSDVVREGVTDLSTTYCRKTIESDNILDVHHACDQGWDGDPAYETFELECYIGGKITVDDTLLGTLCFVDSDPREPFTHNEKAFFNLLLQWCNQMVERRRRLNQAEAIYEHAQDAIFLIDVNTEETFRIRSVNRAYEEMTGLSLAELRGQTPRELLGDEQGGEVETRYQECVAKRAPIEYEEQLTLNGQTLDFQTRLAPVIEENTVVQLVGATRDITERKERERRYSAIFNQTYQFTGLLEPDGTLIEANQTALEFGGLDREDVIGNKMWDTEWFQHSEDTERRAREAVERAADGEFIRHELPVQGADREAIIDFSIRPITDDEGNVTLLIPEGRDITDRIEAEQQLHEEQQFVQSIFQSLPDPLYAFDTEGHPIRWNEEFRTVTGYSDEEIEEMHVTEFVPEDAAETIATNFRTILDEERSITVETAFETRDGTRISFEFTGGPLEAADGTIRGVTGIGRDISERTEREQELRRLKQEYETIFQNVEESLFLAEVADSPDGREFRLRRINPANESVLGVSVEEARGQTPTDIFGEEVGSEIVANYERCLERGEPISYEEQLDLAEGQRTFETTLTPVEIDGERPRIVGIAHDITERTEREQTLQWYEGIVETTRDTAAVLDENRRIKVANSRLADIYDTTPEEMQGRESRLLSHLAEQHEGPDPFEELVQGERTEYRTKLELDYPGYGRRVTDIRMTRLTEDGEFVGVVAVGRDISEQIERQQELERTNAHLEKFVRVVSHDLRNPLNVATSRLALAQEECESEHLESLGQGLDRIGMLIDDLLTLAKEAEPITELEPVSLPEIVESCWETVLTGDAQLVTETTTTIQADRSRLRQVFENLFRNAIDHGGADVTITVGDLPCDQGFYVEDDGPGIANDAREKVFESGYTSQQEGTGFGLNIVEEIIAAHGWEISVTESSEGGARFELTGVEFSAE